MSVRTSQRQIIGIGVALSLIAGLFVAGALLPALAVVGLVANTSTNSFQTVPAILTNTQLPQQTVLLAADGTRLATLYYQDRIEVSIDQIAPIMQDAIVAIEDSRFYQHNGFDLKGTVRAFVSNASGSAVQGGSTITQQYVKNILIAAAKDDSEAAAATARTPARKIREMRYALAIEQIMNKREILNGYLNIAYFGAGAYGVESASRRYFSKSAVDLNLAEASLLAGLVQQPYGYDPIHNPDAAHGRRSVVLRRMVELGYIVQEQADLINNQPLSNILRPSKQANGCTSAIAPFYCDYVVNMIRSSPSFGNTLAERDALLRQGGLTITTTLDLAAQAVAQKAVNSHIPIKDPSGKAAAISMVRPGTGDVIAMAQNRNWGTSGKGNTTYNYNVDRSMGGTIGMQAGSTFKIFVLAAAIEQGISSFQRIYSPSIKTFSGFSNCTNGDIFPAYTSRNSTGSGTFNMRQATAYSVNNYFVALEQQTGICRPAEIAEAMGVRLGNGGDLARVPSFVLGANEVTPLAMANAYATFAAHGLHCQPRVITSVVDRLGQQLQIGGPVCNQVVSREVADGVTEMLNEVIDGSLYGRTGARMYLGRPAAGKTGTTNNSAAVWFSGYTPDLAASVWVGDPRGGFRYPMKNITINGTYFSQVYGGLLPGPIWKQSMLGVLKNSARVNFSLKLPQSVVGRPVTVCPTVPPFDSSSAWPTYCPTPTPAPTDITPTPTPTDSVTATPTPTDVDPTATSVP